MNIDGKPYRTIWLDRDGRSVEIIDQTKLPHRLRDRDAAHARGRGARHHHHAGARRAADRRDGGLRRALWPARGRLGRGARPRLRGARRDASDRHQSPLGARRDAERRAQPAARQARSPPPRAAPPRSATRMSRPTGAIGEHGLALHRARMPTRSRARRVNILTHCNAGWLACVDWGTALAPIYQAHDAGIPVHVWVDETRPRNQGASLTAFELGAHGVPHTLIADNAGGHLMQKGWSISASSAPTASPRTATSPTRSAPI